MIWTLMDASLVAEHRLTRSLAAWPSPVKRGSRQPAIRSVPHDEKRTYQELPSAITE
jgi:hypothetical protein